MNIPLAGPIFALEMVSRDAGISSLAAKSWTAALAASFAGMVFVSFSPILFSPFEMWG